MCIRDSFSNTQSDNSSFQLLFYVLHFGSNASVSCCVTNRLLSISRVHPSPSVAVVRCPEQTDRDQLALGLPEQQSASLSDAF